MRTARISALSGAVLIAATTAAIAGPSQVARRDTLAAPPSPQIEPVHYKTKKHRHARRGPNPGRAVVGTAGGLAGVGVNTAVGTANVLGRGWCDFWGCR
jgi:hypothetical protein